MNICSLAKQSQWRRMNGRAGDNTITQYTMKQHTKLKIINALRPRLCGDNLLTDHVKASSEESSRQSLGKYWQLNKQQPRDRTHTNTN